MERLFAEVTSLYVRVVAGILQEEVSEGIRGSGHERAINTSTLTRKLKEFQSTRWF